MQILDWQQLDAAGRRAARARPAAAHQPRIVQQAQAIIDAVRSEGDAAIRRCAIVQRRRERVLGGSAVVGDERGYTALSRDLPDEVAVRLRGA